MTAGPALAAAARLGPYFTWQPRAAEIMQPRDAELRRPREARDAESGWRPLADLLDPEVAAERVRAGHRVLTRMSGLGPDQISERVVASTIFLGLASRLVSPPLAAAALTGVVPVADPDRLWWRPVAGGPMPIAYDDLAAVEGGGSGLLRRTAIERTVAPLLEVFRRRFALSPHVLWGNVASALGGAAGMIAGNAPAAAERAAALVAELLDRPPLAGMATLTRPDPRRARWFLARNNCCLYYRIPGGGTCGDCVLNRRAAQKSSSKDTLPETPT